MKNLSGQRVPTWRFCQWRIFLTLVIAYVFSAHTYAQSLTYLNSWGSSGSANGQFTVPYFIAISPSGNVYVTDYDNARVEVFSATGAFQSSFSGSGSSQLSDPLGIAINSSGTVYVVSSNTRIEAFSSAGVFQNSFSADGSGPDGLSLNSNGSLYVAESNDGHINELSSAGVLQSTIGTPGSGTGQLDSPQDVAISSNGTMYVADTYNNRIDIFNSAGVFQSSFGSFGGGSGQFEDASGIAVGPTGTVYVTDAGYSQSSPRVEVFNSAGVFESSYVGSLNQPAGVAVAPTGMVYVTNAYGDSIQRLFDPGSWVSGTNTFTDSSVGPTSVAVGSGNLLGTSLTLNSNMGLVIGGSTTVNNGGVLTLNGGTLTTGSLVIDGTTNGANFTQISGSLSTSSITVSHGGVADFVSSPLSVVLSGSVSVSGTTSQFKVDQGATLSATSLTNTGQVYVGTNADLIVYSNTTNGGVVNLGGGELDIRGTLTNSSNNFIQGTGTISTTLGLTNNGTLALAGAANVLGTVANGGTIHLSGTQPNIFFGAVNNAGTINVDAGASGTFYGQYSGAGSVNNAGTVYFNANSISGPITGGGILNVGTPNNPAILHLTSTIGTSVQSALNISSGSTVDVGSSDLILNSGSLSQIAGLISAGFSSGGWKGNGILSSAAATNPDHSTAIGYAQASALGMISFDGQSISPTALLLKYTWIGDANLDGVVNAADLSMMSSSGTTWTSGDSAGPLVS